MEPMTRISTLIRRQLEAHGERLDAQMSALAFERERVNRALQYINTSSAIAVVEALEHAGVVDFDAVYEDDLNSAISERAARGARIGIIGEG